MTPVLIAVSLGGGGLLAIEANDDGSLAQTLTSQYGSQALAADIVALGNLETVGLTLETCIVAGDGDDAVVLEGAWDLECHRSGFQTVHVFENGRWNHQTDAWVTGRT